MSVTADAERRSWRGAPQLHLTVLALLTVVLVGLAIVVPLGYARGAERELTTSLVKDQRHLRAIERVQQSLEAEQNFAETLIAAPPEDLNVALATSANQFLLTQSLWGEYAPLSTVFPEEQALREAFKVARQDAQDITTEAVLSGTISANRGGPAGAAARAAVAEIVAGYDRRINSAIDDARASASSTVGVSQAMGVVAVALLSFAFALALWAARRRERVRRVSDTIGKNEAGRRDLENQLQRGLSMLSEEEKVYPVVAEALAVAAPGMMTELLVADSSRAHFRQVLASSESTPACGVTAPGQCPAANGGQTQLWSSPRAIDACPHLREIDGDNCASACVPVSIAGKTIGVLHATEAAGTLDADEVAGLELVARQTGERVGVMRAFAQSQTQAHTDPLTGLLNRRSLQVEVTALHERGTPYVVVFADLDNFKMLNDVHGHEVGDRALRLFSRVMRDAVRPGDIPARYGGEEFVIVLPDCAMADAVMVIERIRERLRRSSEGSVPGFTASFGLAPGSDVRFDESLAAADHALLQAKERGRDRYVIAGADPDLLDAAVI